MTEVYGKQSGPYEPALSQVLAALGIRHPEDAVDKLGLQPQVTELLGHGVPAEVAERVVLVSYGAAVKHGVEGLAKGIGALFGS